MAAKKTTTKATKTESIAIAAPNFQTLVFDVRGLTPLMQHRFFKKAELMAKMKLGSTAKKGRKKPPRDFDKDFEQSMHRSTDGWIGIPAAAFRNACIDVCRMVGFKMTHARMSIFIEADGFDEDDGQPLVKLIAPKPEKSTMHTRNATGVVDVRCRPMWREWGLKLRVRFDGDQFTPVDVANLVERAGTQVGIGEGRPFSKQSNGMGYGTFTVQDAG